MNDGNIEFFSNAAHNLYSDVTPIHVGADGAIKLSVTHVVPKYERPKDTEWIKQVTFQSPMLSNAPWADFIRTVGTTIKAQAPAGENTSLWNY
jgi:hypothetical protein